jgi:hypothetical protein
MKPARFLLALALCGASTLLPAADKPLELAPTPIGSTGPRVGMAAPDFELQLLDGTTVKGAALWKQKPVLLMTGSHTCPVYRRTASPFEKLAAEFGDRVNFVILYTVEAHPSGEPSIYFGRENVTAANKRDGILWPDAKTMDERVKRANDSVKSLKLKTTMLVDDMDNRVWKAYGSAPNCAYLIGIDGKVMEAQPWFDAGPMRAALEKLLATRATAPGE